MSKTVQIIVEAINDGPSITGPFDIMAEEDTPIAVPEIRVEDPDCDDTPRGVLEVAITTSNGTVQLLGSIAGLYLMEALPGALKIRGKITPINTALAGLSYAAIAEFSGEDTIVVTADDLGNSGTGGRLEAILSIHVTVVATNDPPKISVPPELDLPAGGVLFVVEDQPMALGRFEVSDPDDIFLRVRVSTNVGSISIDDVVEDSLVLVIWDEEVQTGTGSRVTFEGTFEEVSTAISRLTYTSSHNWNSVSDGRDVVEVSRGRKIGPPMPSLGNPSLGNPSRKGASVPGA